MWPTTSEVSLRFFFTIKDTIFPILSNIASFATTVEGIIVFQGPLMEKAKQHNTEIKFHLKKEKN